MATRRDETPRTSAGEAGDQRQRVEELVRGQFAFVWRLARRAGLAPADADDATQQALLIAARRMNDLEPGKERAFLFRVIGFVASKMRRSQQRRREELSGSNDDDNIAEGDPEQSMREREDRARLDGILASMTEDLRNAFVLFEIEGLAQREIAAALGIPEGTVASRLRRAREEFTRIAVRRGVLPSNQGVT